MYIERRKENLQARNFDQQTRTHAGTPESKTRQNYYMQKTLTSESLSQQLIKVSEASCKTIYCIDISQSMVLDFDVINIIC